VKTTIEVMRGLASSSKSRSVAGEIRSVETPAAGAIGWDSTGFTDHGF